MRHYASHGCSCVYWFKLWVLRFAFFSLFEVHLHLKDYKQPDVPQCGCCRSFLISLGITLWAEMRAAPGPHRLVLVSQNYRCLEEQTDGSEPAHQVTVSSSAREAVGITTWQLFGKQFLYKMSWWTRATPKRCSHFRKMSSDSPKQHKNPHKPTSLQNTSSQLCMPKKCCFLTQQLKPLPYYRPESSGQDEKNVNTGHLPRKRMNLGDQTSLGVWTHCRRNQKELPPFFSPVASESWFLLEHGIQQPRVNSTVGDKPNKNGFHRIFPQSVFILSGTWGQVMQR